MVNQTITIEGKTVGKGQPCFVIAEAGVNHNGDLERAKQLVDAAVDAGADAVKFQSFVTDELVTPDIAKPDYQERTTAANESHTEMLRRLELSPDAHQKLLAYCHQQGILFLSSPFDHSSIDLLAKLGVGAYKIPSGEITNIPYLRDLGGRGIPAILSTGMSTLGEVEQAVTVLRDSGCSDLVLLHCVSRYPARPDQVNLRAMQTLRRAFQLPTGYSDHTEGVAAILGAVALGACCVEKHLTLDRSLEGPDHQASMEPDAFRRMVVEIRHLAAALGDGRKQPVPEEADTAAVIRKSIVAAKDIPAGTRIQPDDLAVRRPGTGLTADKLPFLYGRRARVLVPANSIIKLEMLD